MNFIEPRIDQTLKDVWFRYYRPESMNRREIILKMLNFIEPRIKLTCRLDLFINPPHEKAGAGSSSVEQQQQQPFLGIVDTGASYTILNTAAANLAGKNDSPTLCDNLVVHISGFRCPKLRP